MSSLQLLSFLLCVAFRGCLCNTHLPQVAKSTNERSRSDVARDMSVKETLELLVDEIQDVKERLQALELDNAKSKRSNISLSIAFSAYAEQDLTYGELAIIQFPKVNLNLGSNYNPATSIFTCSDAGIYYFAINLYVSVSMSASNAPNIDLVKDNVPIIGLRADMVDMDSLMMSNSVLVNCDPFQQVNLKTTTDVIVLAGTAASTFTGYLISPT